MHSEFAPQAARVPVFQRALGSWHVAITRQPLQTGDLAAAYDAQALGWQRRIDRLGFDAGYRHLLRTVLRQPRYRQAAPRLAVLDVGIGTGAMTAALCDLEVGALRVEGIDISPDMLAQAAARLQGRAVDLTLRPARVEALPFPDNHFDVVLAAHVLEHAADPEAALQALYRVVKPGGVLIASLTRQSWGGAYVQMLWRNHQVGRRTALGWLRQAGFRAVRAVPYPKGRAARRFSLGYVGGKPGRKGA